jgi:superfamily I DNA/RNA helicase
MRSLRYARERARSCRQIIGTSSDQLFERVVRYLAEVYEIELEPTTKAFLEGGRAEVSPAEGVLFYDEQLDIDTYERLLVLLHELGHLELHPRLRRSCTTPEPLAGSMYLNDGAPSLARYNRHGREETEANSFAVEFLCPCNELFDKWLSEVDSTSASLAKALSLPVYLIQAQLAEALYETTLGQDEQEPKKPVDPDASQLDAAMYVDGPALVNAGPGTGKTATLIARIDYLLEQLHASPESILVLTFSNDAAEELMDRIQRKFGSEIASRIEVNTFHGLGVSLIHHHGHFLDIDANASVVDEVGQQELVANLLGTVDCSKIIKLYDPLETAEEIVGHIGFLKDRVRFPKDLSEELKNWTPSVTETDQYERARQFLQIFEAYEAAKKEAKRLDFADLIALPIRIFEQQPALVSAYRAKYRWVMVDEYQDVSRSVSKLLAMLCGATTNPPWVVGDTRQAIYQFRGAAPENVDEFENDFENARIFYLDTNYRSSHEIVRAANQMATLIEQPERTDSTYTERWKPAAPYPALGDPSVLVAIADSDQAEQVGIANQVEAWIDMNVSPRDIAVLARRNVDVRNIVLTLGTRGVRATTSGLITAEGAAGDLAEVVTFANRPRASLPRLACALGLERFGPDVTNAVIKEVLSTIDQDGKFAEHDFGEGNTLVAEIRRANNALKSANYTGDAFTMMCLFLFDGSDYLRAILNREQGAARSLMLDEIITSLSRSAVYRFTHSGVEPWESRKAFGEYFRTALCSSTPCLIPPRSTTDAVRVMTCHASKGLEFPCVVVAGQTRSRVTNQYAWLPPSWQPTSEVDLQQANSVFFVGVTRAQQSLFVSCATTATGTPHSQQRTITPLLERWQSIQSVDTVTLDPMPPVNEEIVMGPIWGGSPYGPLPARSLDKDSCAIRTYLEKFLQIYFPLSLRPLYPIFFSVVRHALREILALAHTSGEAVSEEDARRILFELWPKDEDLVDHPHGSIYLNLALRYVVNFAQVYKPEPKMAELLNLIIDESEMGPALRLDLVAHYRDTNGIPIALSFRPESLANKVRSQGLLWGGLKAPQRVGFVVLREMEPIVQPFVFSGDDGILHSYQWTNKQADYNRESTRVTSQLKAFGQGIFQTTLKARTCDRCPARVSCPHWMGLLANG